MLHNLTTEEQLQEMRDLQRRSTGARSTVSTELEVSAVAEDSLDNVQI